MQIQVCNKGVLMMKILDARRLEFVFVQIYYVMGITTVQMAVMKKTAVCSYICTYIATYSLYVSM